MSYEFTGRYSPSQIASGLQTYGSTGAAMSPEQNNPVSMPQNNQKQDIKPQVSMPSGWDIIKGEQDKFSQDNPGSTYKLNITQAFEQHFGTPMDQWKPEQKAIFDNWYNNEYAPAVDANQSYWAGNTVNNGGGATYETLDTPSWGSVSSNDSSGGEWNMANPVAGMGRSDYYGGAQQGGMGGNFLGDINTGYDQYAKNAQPSAEPNYEQGGMGGNFLGDVDFSKQSQPNEVNYDFAGRPTDHYIQPDAQVFSPNYANPNAVNTSAPEPNYRGKMGDDYRSWLSGKPMWQRDLGGTAATALAGALGGPMAAIGANRLLTSSGTYNLPNPDNSGWIRAENAARNVIPMFRPIDDAVRGLWSWAHPQNQELANSMAGKGNSYAFTRGQ